MKGGDSTGSNGSNDTNHHISSADFTPIGQTNASSSSSSLSSSPLDHISNSSYNNHEMIDMLFLDSQNEEDASSSSSPSSSSYQPFVEPQPIELNSPSKSQLSSRELYPVSPYIDEQIKHLSTTYKHFQPCFLPAYPDCRVYLCGTIHVTQNSVQFVKDGKLKYLYIAFNILLYLYSSHLISV
tara:strand:+ start:1403 stop:1951 length:549 start_codon:yes stop_codon:yes gene_type:complete